MTKWEDSEDILLPDDARFVYRILGAVEGRDNKGKPCMDLDLVVETKGDFCGVTISLKFFQWMVPKLCKAIGLQRFDPGGRPPYYDADGRDFVRKKFSAVSRQRKTDKGTYNGIDIHSLEPVDDIPF